VPAGRACLDLIQAAVSVSMVDVLPKMMTGLLNVSGSFSEKYRKQRIQRLRSYLVRSMARVKRGIRAACCTPA